MSTYFFNFTLALLPEAYAPFDPIIDAVTNFN